MIPGSVKVVINKKTIEFKSKINVIIGNAGDIFLQTYGTTIIIYAIVIPSINVHTKKY